MARRGRAGLRSVSGSGGNRTRARFPTKRRSKPELTDAANDPGSAWAESPAQNDGAFARGDRLRRAVVGALERRPQRQSNPITAVGTAIAERTERRFHSAVVRRWDDVLEF